MGWKIVRDNDEAVCRAMGISGQWRPSVTPIPGLTRKVFEEAAEFAEGNDPGELYDLRDVLDELIRRLDPAGEAAETHQVKVAKRGAFTFCLEWTPVPGELPGESGDAGS
jgi:hypothetical protein